VTVNKKLPMTRFRGRPRLSADAKKFREEIARELRAAIDSRGLSVTKAANALGVSRQAFHQYLSAKATPHPEVIARAMDLWSIEPSYKGEKIARGALGGSTGMKARDLHPSQLSLVSLFDVPQECHNDNLVVTVLSSRDSTLHVTIKMKKADGPVPRGMRSIAAKAG
jgi:transcriptional regulator with XRE-family HTH domain